MDFVAIDFETANGRRDSICSIGMSRFSKGKEVERYYQLINPQQAFHPANIQVHGIYPNHVANEKRFDQLYPEIRAFIGQDPLVAHFAQFDIQCLQTTIESYHLPKMDNVYFCSCILAKKQLTLPSNKLIHVLDYYGLTIDHHHNAADDAAACGQITSKLLAPYNYDINGFLKDYHYQMGQLFSHRFGPIKASKKSAPKLQLHLKAQTSQFDPKHPFYQKQVAFLGRLSGLKRQDAAQILTNVGGFFQSSLTSETTYLVVSNSEWRKIGTSLESKAIEQARQLQGQNNHLTLLSEKDFFMVF